MQLGLTEIAKKVHLTCAKYALYIWPTKLYNLIIRIEQNKRGKRINSQWNSYLAYMVSMEKLKSETRNYIYRILDHFISILFLDCLLTKEK